MMARVLSGLALMTLAVNSSATVSVGFGAALTNHAVLQRGGSGSTVCVHHSSAVHAHAAANFQWPNMRRTRSVYTSIALRCAQSLLKSTNDV